MLGVQFLFPSGILVLAHARIYHKLVSLPFWGRKARQVNQEGGQQDRVRGNKTIYLLVCVVLVFVCTWLPLNLLNIFLDLGLLDHLLG